MTNAASQIAVGIDLGTTYSVAAHLDGDGRPWTVLNAEGDLTTPSVVFFDKSAAIVGKEAVKVAEYEPERIARFAKRDMGRESFHKTIRGEQLPPEVVQAIILKKLKADAELKLGPFDKAVVTVPAYFNEPMRKATQDAGRLAGLEVLDIINEPTAAAISFGVQQGFLNVQGESQKQETILVYDLGGGTFDATLMDIDGHSYNAIATLGDVYLGGIDWDRRIIDFIAEQFQQQHGIDPRKDDGAFQSLLAEAEDAKRTLSAREETMIHFAHDGHQFRTTLTREEFETRTGDLLDRTMITVRKLLREADRSWSDISRLLLVGGSSRMPMIHKMLGEESGLQLDRSLSPDEAVAHGAAIYAGLLLSTGEKSKKGMSVQNVNSHDLGVLGIETSTGMKRRHVMIARNSALPTMATNKFKTYKDNQKSVKVDVIEGGDASGHNSTPIGKCVIDDLPGNLPKGTPVEVIFKYADNGRLTVHAWLPTANRKADLAIERASGLSDETLQTWIDRVQQGLPDVARDAAISTGEAVQLTESAPPTPTVAEPKAPVAPPPLTAAIPPQPATQPPPVVKKQKPAVKRKQAAAQQPAAAQKQPAPAPSQPQVAATAPVSEPAPATAPAPQPTQPQPTQPQAQPPQPQPTDQAEPATKKPRKKASWKTRRAKVTAAGEDGS